MYVVLGIGTMYLSNTPPSRNYSHPLYWLRSSITLCPPTKFIQATHIRISEDTKTKVEFQYPPDLF